MRDNVTTWWHQARTGSSLLWTAVALYIGSITPLIVLYPKMVLPILVGMLIFVGILWRPFIGIVAATFLGMIGDLQHFSGSISLVKFTIVLTLISFLAHSSLIRKFSLVDSGLEVPLIIFTLTYVFGTLMNLTMEIRAEDAPTGFEGILTMLGYPVAFLLFLNMVNSERRIRWVLIAVVAGAFVAGVASALQQFADFNVLSSVRGIEQVTASNGVQGMDRIDGLMQDPNAAAYPHILGLPLAVILILSTKSKAQKAVLGIAAAVCLLGLALTFSRSGYLALGVSFLFLPFFLAGKRTMRIYCLSGAFLLLLTSFIPMQLLTERFDKIGEERGGESDRSVYFETAADELVQHPLLPSGEADFIGKIEQKVGVRQGPHANIQAVMINSGIIGLFAISLFAIRYVRLVARRLREMPESPMRFYAVGSFLAMIGFQFQGLFITNMNWFLMWAMLAIPICCVLKAESEHKRQLIPLRPQMSVYER